MQDVKPEPPPGRALSYPDQFARASASVIRHPAGFTPALVLTRLHAIVRAGGADLQLATRHATRLHFAMQRVAELMQDAESVGGVFVPARMEVAASILAEHLRCARAFLRQVDPKRITDAHDPAVLERAA